MPRKPRADYKVTVRFVPTPDYVERLAQVLRILQRIQQRTGLGVRSERTRRRAVRKGESEEGE